MTNNKLDVQKQICVPISQLVMPSEALFFLEAKSKPTIAENDSTTDQISSFTSKLTQPYILFQAANLGFLIDAEMETKIIESPKLHRLPNVRDLMPGVINVRGDFIPVVDLKKFLAQSGNVQTSINNDNEKVLLVGSGPKTIGIYIQSFPSTVNLAVENFISLEHLDNEITLPSKLSTSIKSVCAEGIDQSLIVDFQNEMNKDLDAKKAMNSLYYLDVDVFFKTIINEAVFNG